MDSSNVEISGISILRQHMWVQNRRSTYSVDWVRIATEIELNYATFDAFVILHGTDTMAYTASAISFMLEDLGKTVASCITIKPSLRTYNDDRY